MIIWKITINYESNGLQSLNQERDIYPPPTPLHKFWHFVLLWEMAYDRLMTIGQRHIMRENIDARLWDEE